MKIKLYRSATVGIDFGNFKILKDPWLTDAEYYGSWSHYPPYDLEKNLSEINSYNAIYISHIHPDHCSEATMNKINKNIPVYVHKFHSQFLKKKIENWGFKVFELGHNEEIEIQNSIFINIYAADDCKPELCYKFTGCADFTMNKGSQYIDTMAVFRNDKFVLLNVNDCPFELAKEAIKKIKMRYSKIDVLLMGYGGAGPYPQCFDNLDYNQKVTASKKKEELFLEQGYNYIKETKPNYYLPFAGTYVLAGKLSVLNNLRGVPSPDKAYQYYDLQIKKFNLENIFPIKINPDSEFDMNTKKVSKEYVLFNELNYQNYILNTLSNIKMTYDNDPETSTDELFDLAKKAFEKYSRNVIAYNINLISDIYIKIFEKFIKISNKRKEIYLIEKNDIDHTEQFVMYMQDEKLLKRLLLGPKFAHWNNAEIGSQINFFRKPDIYERNLYQAMCYFHV